MHMLLSVFLICLTVGAGLLNSTALLMCRSQADCSGEAMCHHRVKPNESGVCLVPGMRYGGSCLFEGSCPRGHGCFKDPQQSAMVKGWCIPLPAEQIPPDNRSTVDRLEEHGVLYYYIPLLFAVIAVIIFLLQK